MHYAHHEINDSGDNNPSNRDIEGEEEGEVRDEELDDYEKELHALLGDAKVTGPEICLMEEDKNPPMPDWLGRDDIPAAIRKLN